MRILLAAQIIAAERTNKATNQSETNQPKNTMTPKQFCKVCLLFGSKTPGEVADLFKTENLPPLAEVNVAALEMMDGITPHDSTIAAHARLWEVAEWACEAEARRLYTKALAVDAMTSEVQA